MAKIALCLVWLKWFSILWTVISITVIAISHMAIVNKWKLAFGLSPFDVTNSLGVAILLLPGAIAVGIHLFFESK